jgi:mono/diheme cytochrome c family protein
VGNTVYWANGRTLSAFSVPAAGTRFAVAHNSAVGEGGVTTASGVFTAAQADRGRMVYAESCAAGCHLPNLAGGGPTPDLAGAGFLSRWDGLSVADLFKKISSTMPKASPGSLDQQDYLAVTAFLLLANGMKPGSQALAVNGNNLGKIEITAAP